MKKEEVMWTRPSRSKRCLVFGLDHFGKSCCFGYSRNRLKHNSCFLSGRCSTTSEKLRTIIRLLTKYQRLEHADSKKTIPYYIRCIKHFIKEEFLNVLNTEFSDFSLFVASHRGCVIPESDSSSMSWERLLLEGKRGTSPGVKRLS